MNGSQFLETLKQLGYPNAEQITDKTFDWIFENEATVPFLNWFCTNISQRNIVDPNVLKEYHDIEAGDCILDNALKAVATSSDSSLSQESLEAEVSSLSERLENCKKKKHHLLQRRNKLSVRHTALSYRLSKLPSLESEVKSQFKKRLDQCHQTNSEVNYGLKELIESVGQLNELYKQRDVSQTSTEKSDDGVFLSQLSLDEYFTAEEKFCQHLNDFTKKRFFQGIAEVAGQTEDSRYELLEVSDPNSLLVRGEEENVNASHSDELKRLQRTYPKSECQRINALVDEKRLKSSLYQLEDVLQRLQLGRFSKDKKTLSDQLQKTHSLLQGVQCDMVKLSESHLPRLIRELSGLQGTCIVTGDYMLKLARQDYFTSNQDQVIQQLVVQRARTDFLLMAYTAEERHHREVQHLLMAVQLRLKQLLSGWEKRMKMLEDPALTSARHQRGTIDSRDMATTRLHCMLDDEKSSDRHEKPLFITLSSLVEAAQRLEKRHEAAQTALSHTYATHDKKVKEMEDSLLMLEDKIYSGSSTSGGEPMLRPHQVQEMMTQLKDIVHKLQATIVSIVSDYSSKQKTLKSDELLVKERRIFEYFYTKPNKLQQLLDSAATRLQAQQIHAD
ncbi:HAUS augmin-like complex subunit 3 [Gigantopelta aegis]|uniref:HAUS augmin-like complex subunit 3 n=1 Tax=Gigantopelta aegis TaxID=1735272 RepID=UPI001B88D0AF|nr:HAUS augmin-like complex subunit 3 [Gigantopelta aegis]XP_041359957.1 HAUS augmin-like complex subunit 3 [Gigantopelta aegis]